MTVSNTTIRVNYTGDGSSVNFAVPFLFYATADLEVLLASAVQSVGYTVTGAGTGSGTVTFASPPATGVTVTIVLNVPLTQLANLVDGTAFPSATLNEINDRAIQACLRLNDRLGRAITAPDGDVSPNMALPPASQRANTYLTFDSNGDLSASQSLPPGTTLSQATVGITLYPANGIELALGITIAKPWIPYYYISRYGNVGTGADDAAVFNAVGALGVTIFVPELTGTTSYKLNSNVSGIFEAVGNPRFTGSGTIGLVSDVGVRMDSNVGTAVGGYQNASVMMLIGDSITGDTGASAYTNGYAWTFGRSVMNNADEGVFQDSGFGYHSVVNTAGVGTPGVTSTGATVSRGIWNNRLNLSGAQTLTITLRECLACDVIYDASNSSGSFTIALNGTVVSTVSVTGSGFKTTSFPTYLKTIAPHYNTRLSDVITIQSTSGSLDVCAVLTVKNSQKNPCLCFIGGAAGYAYQDYTTSAAMDELAFYLNATAVFGGLQNKTLVCNLGTNNMYNAGKALSPAATIAQIDALRTGMNSRCSFLNFVISVPPKSNESLFPMILGYKYEDYVHAIVSYAVANNIQLIRHDLSALNSGNYYADGLHPNDAGHRIFAMNTLIPLGIKYDLFFKSVDFGPNEYVPYLRTDGAITLNAPWGPFGGLASFAPRAHLVGGMLYLSGVVVPNGSGSTLIGTLPTGFVPDTQDRYVTTLHNVSGGTMGVSKLVIHAGQLNIDAVPTTDVTLDGICVPLLKFIDS